MILAAILIIIGWLAVAIVAGLVIGAFFEFGEGAD